MLQQILYSFLPLLFLVASCSERGTDSSQAEFTEEQALVNIDTAGLSKATFAGGCFWCTEAYFERLEGVEAVISGYSGGTKPNPTYSEVSAGSTNYAESVQVYYNPDKISFSELVEVFFATHDPTTLNRQGPDIGKQYRSIAFYRTPEEKKIIVDYINKLEQSGAYQNDIVTSVEPFKKFWQAEEYHQDYYERNPNDPYVTSVARPKVQKFESNYHNKLKSEYMN
ncbi:peptide-methionine (S)-S-oxide reductase MsrA [Pontibacter sp. MBLB2868]|uniref:peptide-methionine (S)-S-oxide reductase MsrA n=1 Tax=Pontibacter sp. MBLB2868 TaxID=3451555 RepID=UPI003F74FECB